MSGYQEKQIVRQFRGRTVMGPAEKREAIARVTRISAQIDRSTPGEGAKLLHQSWEAVRALDIGCRPVVC